MKFACDRKVLAAALAAAVRIVSRRTTIPILGNLLVAAADGALRLTADNLDMRVVAEIPVEVERPGAATLPAHVLDGIVRTLPADGRLTLDAPEGERATLRCGRSRSTLATLPAIDFPDGARDEWAHRFDLPGRDLARALERCLGAASTEETRYYLNGVMIHAHESPDDDPALRFVATDGHRLVLTALPLPEAAAHLPWTILPRLAAAEVIRLASAVGEGDVAMAASRRLMRFGFPGGLTLVTKLIDGSFPDYVRVIPAGNSKVVRVGRAPLREAIERVRQVRDAGANGAAAKFAFAAGRLTLSMKSELNEAVEEVDVETADQVETGYNTRYAIELLEALEGDTVTFELEDPGSPAVLRSEVDRNTRCILMPVRV